MCDINRNISFENIQPKYFLNEDITLVYVVHDKTFLTQSTCNKFSNEGDLAFIFQNQEIRNSKYSFGKQKYLSSRDWIGLFVRGWSNLEQYISFEWTVGRPYEEVPPRRNVRFPSKFFRSHVNTRNEYQFLYVNEYNKVLGNTTFFRFVGNIPICGYPSDELWYYNRLLTNEKEEHEQKRKVDICDEECNKQCLSYITAGKCLPNVNDNEEPLVTTVPVKMDNISSSTIVYPTMKFHSRNSNGETHKLPSSLKYCLPSTRTVVAPGLPLNFFGQQKNNSESKSCPVCRSPSNYPSVLKGLNDKVLTLHEQVRTMENRCSDLQSKLELGYAAQQQLRVMASHARQERDGFHKFVNQLLQSLKCKGMLRIIDAEGTEIYVKNVGYQVKACAKPDHLGGKQLTMAPQDRLIEELKAKLRKTEEFSQDLGNVVPLDKELIFNPLTSDQCIVDSTETIMLNDTSNADEDKNNGAETFHGETHLVEEGSVSPDITKTI